MNKLAILKARVQGRIKTLEITQEDFDLGQRSSPQFCPVARAVARLFGTFEDGSPRRVIVTPGRISVYEMNGNITLWHAIDRPRFTRYVQAIDYPDKYGIAMPTSFAIVRM